MILNFLLPETVARQNGSGPELDLDSAGGKNLLLTLGITRTVEQESLDVEIWGSADKLEWGEKPILRFPQKFYCGTYSMMLNLAKRPEIRFLRVSFRVNRWGRGDSSPLFGFYVFVQEAAQGAGTQAAVA